MSKQIAAMREQGVAIAAVCIAKDYVVFYNGLVLPINCYYDDDGEETYDKDEAVGYEFGDEEHGFGFSAIVDSTETTSWDLH